MMETKTIDASISILLQGSIKLFELIKDEHIRLPFIKTVRY